jgi:hypothetical protein
MTGRRDSFSKLDVTVTMTGGEWLAIARLLGSAVSRFDPESIIAVKLLSQILNANMAAAAGSCFQQQGAEQ